ncbi:glycerate kinase [Microbacteriaceae bacterium SG_E_30_P1]|uniref:Glycerate kinase n=1 Tax=Antiquaquibacter oligotrophicus TaxID=2880260 RepID=A0ABT6KQU1_9MICO|nr:glycerate kinase [Antiquaquibacter oligotrophicus]MDH6182140.1 glycerate kinase [Antiquaquibacter oligotrophicus]UDF12197.1 glycerate kinase [Antiquaquibacter oligotrophicus]
MKVVIAPDSFKGTLSAGEAAAAIAEGWRSIRAHDDLELLPQADGGEGTLDAIAASVPGSRLRDAGVVHGPDGRAVDGLWLELPGGTAVVELAQCSGISLMRDLDARGATTRGLGEVIARAISQSPTSLLIALGGSASTDGGSGALAALGLVLTDGNGRILRDGGGFLRDVAAIDRSGLVTLPPVTLLTDVRSPLLGPGGAARVFGPQKGASAQDVATLEQALARFADLLGGAPESPGMGAAGGTAYGFAAAYGARIVPGADYISAITGLDRAIVSSDLVITGEGRFDDQSMAGKVTGSIIAAARSAGVPAAVIAGAVEVEGPLWTASLSSFAGSPKEAMSAPARWLAHAGARAAESLAPTVSRRRRP